MRLSQVVFLATWVSLGSCWGHGSLSGPAQDLIIVGMFQKNENGQRDWTEIRKWLLAIGNDAQH